MNTVPTQPPSEITETMVSRFLCWRLPDDFAPDAGISFTPNPMPHCWPVGTNLLTAVQAKAMLEHIFGITSENRTPAPVSEGVLGELPKAVAARYKEPLGLGDYVWHYIEGHYSGCENLYTANQMHAFRQEGIAQAQLAHGKERGEWIAVSDRLPDKDGCFLAVIAPPRSKPYVSLACFGAYEYYTEDDAPKLAPGETLYEDESRVAGKGWHNEEDSHGGEYDTYVLTYFDGCSRGQVTHWMPRPPLPELAAAPHPQQEGQDNG